MIIMQVKHPTNSDKQGPPQEEEEEGEEEETPPPPSPARQLGSSRYWDEAGDDNDNCTAGCRPLHL